MGLAFGMGGYRPACPTAARDVDGAELPGAQALANVDVLTDSTLAGNQGVEAEPFCCSGGPYKANLREMCWVQKCYLSRA